MVSASERIPMRLPAWCLMPNHFHLVLWPLDDGDLSSWMHWLMTTHARRHHLRWRTVGRIWEGRFKAFAIQEDGHLLSVMRYVESNPVRAGLSSVAQAWPWSSAGEVGGSIPVKSPIHRPSGWLDSVNKPESHEDLERIRTSVHRGSPFGDEGWRQVTAAWLGLESSLRTGRWGRSDGGHA